MMGKGLMKSMAWIWAGLLVAMGCGFTVSTAFAAEPPKDPILRIETGMHTAEIRRIGVDAEDRYLVTSSDDKTVRVMEVATGNLIRTLRIPIGPGNEGKIYAVAISPDGKTIACGGITQAGEKFHNIYLFDRESGVLTKRITGLPDVIFHLAFARDGSCLAACLGGKNGIRLYRTSDYSQIGEDRDYGDMSFGADFSDPKASANSSLLVAASYDGFIRLYAVSAYGNPSLHLLSKVQAKSGKQPFSVSFVPFGLAQGTKIAVGYENVNKVDVYSAGKDGDRRLQYLYSPDTTGITEDLRSVAWSADGTTLYAGGRHYYNYGRGIRKWAGQGLGSYTTIISGADKGPIAHIIALKKGGVAFGAVDASFGVIDGRNESLYVKRPFIANYSDNQDWFLISPDGNDVKLSFEPKGRSPAQFSVKEGLLRKDPSSSGIKLSPPLTSAKGLDITGWNGTLTPRLNGTPLKLMPTERSLSLAIAPDREGFLLGTSWSRLFLFDAKGTLKWQIPLPTNAWVLNISGDSKTAVAALRDGTIRWYRMKDGKELLAVFFHSDKKRWVSWTPSGYFNASAGAEEIIGWHVNNGKDSAADFYPLSKFRSAYYRPDVLAKVLETTDEKEAVRLANDESGRKQQAADVRQMLPPVVTILSPADNTALASAKVMVRYSIRTPSGEPVTALKALVDGRPVAGQRGVQITAKQEVLEMEVAVPERDCEVSIIAENRYTASEPAMVRLRWKGEVKREEFIIKPKLYVLSIGVSKYEDKALMLDFAGKDARDFAGVMKRQESGLYREVEIKVLTDGQATKDDIMDGLDWLRRETTSKDVAMLFLAGHGVNDQGGIYYYLPVNANRERLMRTGVAFSDIKNTVASLAGKTVLFVDTCHAGNVMGKRRAVADINAVVNELASAENGAVVFASSTSNQYALEDRTWGNGAFTKALVEGITGKADFSGKGRITINMLDLYLSERVKELTKGQQTPTTTKPQTIPDFPIAVRR